MHVRYTRRVLGGLMLAIPAFGCQNELRVEVQMIAAVDEKGRESDILASQRVTEPSLRAAAEASMLALQRYKTFPDRLMDYLKERGISDSITSNSRSDFAEIIGDEPDKLIAEGAELLGKITSKSEGDQSLAGDVFLYTQKVAAYLEARRREWLTSHLRGMAATATADERRAANTYASEFGELELTAVVGSAREGVGNATGFGGFRLAGVFEILPGDPDYYRVLRGKPVGNPITASRAGALGDSTIMFVQESPAQIRVYSVDLDPRMLIQNILYITDKILQAALKYVGPLP